MALPFETNLQQLLYQMDVGAGRKVVQAVLLALFAGAMAALYTFTNFQGLRDPCAMEQAQLARNLAEHGRLVTQSVRPFSIGYLAARSEEGEAPVLDHPDLFHPPAWPWLLSRVFRVTGIPEEYSAPSNVYGWDYLPVAVNHVFTILAALWVWLVARRLFNAQVGALSVGAFLISDLVWARSLTGGNFAAAMFFALGAVYAALRAAELPAGASPQAGEGPAWRWWLPLAASAALTAAAFLTRYAAGNIALVVFLYLGFSRRRRSWSHAGLYVALALLFVSPWLVRNLRLSGNLLGLASYEALAGTMLFPDNALFRTLEPRFPDLGAGLYYIQLKMMANLRKFGAQGFGLAGSGFLLAVFGAMYLHRFVRSSSRTLRWCLIPGAVTLLLGAAAYGSESLWTMAIFWPLAIPYAWAFILVLLDRLQFEARFFATGALTLVMFLSGLPLLLQVLPPRTGLPYPPYFYNYIGPVASFLEPDECMVTDIPWAVAWYGNRTAILLPRHIDGFYEIDRRYQPIAMAYFTTVTRNQPWVRALADPAAPEYSWYQLFAAQRVPGGFPLRHGRFLAGSDQLLLSDRLRW